MNAVNLDEAGRVKGDGLQAGERIGGRYRLDAHIGAGGMANVWRATDETLDRPVAVKFLYAKDAAQRERLSKAFVREARIAAAVRHRYVVSILDFGTHTDDVPYMVMELLEGETLGDLLARRKQLPVAVVVDLVAHVLEGLAAVHEAGIVHRDLKPENVFVQSERNRVFPKLLDFGISRADGESGRRSALTTHDGQLLGTPQYMSPEQASGEGKVDLRTDLYSLGVIMYEALTGKLPFDSEGVGALIVQIITGVCPSVRELVPEVGAPLSDFVARAMAKEPEDRFQDATSMHHALIAATERALGPEVAQSMSMRPPMGAEFEFLAPSDDAREGAAPDGSRAVAEASTLLLSAPEGDTPLSSPLVEPETPRRGRGFTLALAALALGGAVALGIAQLAPAPAPAASEPHFIVVQGAGAPAAAATAEVVAHAAAEPAADEPPRAAARADDTTAAAADDTTAPAADDAPPSEAGARRSRAKPAAGGASLAQTFAKHKRQIGACFDVKKGQEPPELSLRISLAKSGHVDGVEVLPASHAATDLGKCVRRVAEGIEFGRQKEALSFRVPLTVRVGR